MNLKQIEAFVKIANNKSFSKTAKEMYLTQPTVSAAIRNLEDELEMPLFVRSTRDVELTEGGKQIYLYARQMLELANAIHKISTDASVKDEDRHEIVVTSSTIPSQYILPELMSRFSMKYPETQFRITVSDSAKVIQDVEEHKADIGLCGIVPEKKYCTSFPIYNDELLIVTPSTGKYRNYAQGNDSSIDWILEEPVILREEGSGTKAEAIRYLERAGIRMSDLNITASIGNTSAILQAVKKGMGITFMSRLAAQEAMDEKRVLAFPFSTEGCFRTINLIYNSAFPQSEMAKRFIRFVKNQNLSMRIDREESQDRGEF